MDWRWRGDWFDWFMIQLVLVVALAAMVVTWSTVEVRVSQRAYERAVESGAFRPATADEEQAWQLRQRRYLAEVESTHPIVEVPQPAPLP